MLKDINYATIEGNEKNALSEKEENESYPIKNKIWKTIGTFLACVCLGLLFPLVGVTETNMEVLYSTTTDGFSATFIGRALGYLAGAILCGVLYSRANPELQLAIAGLAQSLPVLVAPFLPMLGLFITAIVVHRVACGYIDTVGETYVIQLWPESKFKTSLLIGQTVALSIGSSVSPFLIAPFLTPLSGTPSNNTSCRDPVSLFGTHSLNVDSSPPGAPTHSQGQLVNLANHIWDRYEERTARELNKKLKRHMQKDEQGLSETRHDPTSGCEFPRSLHTNKDPDVSKVRLAYIIIGLLSAIGPVYYAFLLPWEADWGRNHLQSDAASSDGSPGKLFTVVLVTLNAFYCFLFQILEGTPDAYLAVYVTLGLGKGVRQAAHVVGVFWGAHGLGSVVGIPLAVVLGPVTLSLVNLVICLCGSVLMTFSHAHESVIWVASALLGFGVATLYSASFGWCSEYITVTGFVASVFVTAYSLSAAIVQPVIGHLFNTSTPDAMIYIIFVANVLAIFVFLAELGFVHKWSMYAEGWKRTI